MNVEPRQFTRNILRIYRTSSPASIAAGLEWYDGAFTVCERLAFGSGRTVTQAVCALAHLSPRVQWSRNVEILEVLLRGQSRPVWALTRSWGFAQNALRSEYPLDTFGKGALKTRSFALAILGDRNAVTVDIWAARAAGAPEDSIARSGGYVAIADAYRRAARRVDISARDLQAITWCSVRGAAA